MNQYIKEKINSLTHRKQKEVVEESRYFKKMDNPELTFNSSKYSNKSPLTLKNARLNGLLTIDNPCRISKVVD